MTNIISSRRASRAMVLACWLVYSVAYIARNTYSASIVTLTGAGLLSQSDAGLIGTCYFVCYGAGHLINGILADRISPVFMIVTGLCGTTVCNLLMTAVTPTVWLMLIVWSANGFLQAMLWSPIIHILSGMIAPSTRDRALVVMAATVPAGTIAAYLITSVCSYFGASWTLPYLIASGATAAVCAIFLLLRQSAVRIALTDPDAADEVVPEVAPELASQSAGHSIIALLAASGTLVFLIPVVFHGMLKDGVMTWVPSMLTDSYGISDSLSTLLAVMLPIANLAGSFISNFLFIHVFRRNHAATGALVMLLTAIPTALVLKTGQFPLAVIVACLALVSMLTTGFNYIFSSLIPAEFAVFGRASTVSGVFNSTIYVGSALSTYVFGAVAQRLSWNATVAVWLALTLISAAVLLAMVRPWRRFLNRLG